MIVGNIDLMMSTRKNASASLSQSAAGEHHGDDGEDAVLDPAGHLRPLAWAHGLAAFLSDVAGDQPRFVGTSSVRNYFLKILS